MGIENLVAGGNIVEWIDEEDVDIEIDDNEYDDDDEVDDTEIIVI